MPLQIRRGTAAEKDAMTAPLANGELLWVTDDKKLYVGDGLTLPISLAPASGFNAEDAKDAAATLFTQGGHVGITFSYDDSFNSELGRITAELDLSDYQGVITADSFSGSFVADDSTTIINGTDGSINLNGTIKAVVAPNTNGLIDIGTPSAKFKDIYTTSLYLGTAQITTPGGSIVNLPAGSTVGGIEISSFNPDSSLVADLQGSVFGDDSTTLVNAIDNTIFGSSINTTGISLTGSILSTNGTSLEIQPRLDTFVQIPVNFNILAASTLTSIADSDFQAIDIRAFSGSVDNPVDIVQGDVLGTLSFSGFSVTSNVEIGCLIGAQCDPDPGTNTDGGAYIPTKFFVVNQAASGLGDPPPFLTFDSFGRLAVNQENAVATLDVNGFAKLAILDTEPATPANGMIAIADGDAIDGWDPLGNGKQSMVVRLGGAWVQIAAAA